MTTTAVMDTRDVYFGPGIAPTPDNVKHLIGKPAMTDTDHTGGNGTPGVITDAYLDGYTLTLTIETYPTA